MTETPNITLEQWRALVAVVDAGGYAQAAKSLRKSQSSVSYAVQKLEQLLGVAAFQIEGRKAVLTPAGQLLYRRARALLDEAVELEHAAQRASAGWEAELRVAVEVLFPASILLSGLARFGTETPHTRVEVFDTVIEGSIEALVQRRVDLAIAPRVPPGLPAQPLLRLRFVLAAHPEHPLHKLGRELTTRDLRKHRHLVVRDTASKRDSRTGTVDVAQRWTFGSMSMSIQAARRGHGFAWYPEEMIREELREGTLRPLTLRGGADRYVHMYLIFAEPDAAGPGAQRLAQIIREEVTKSCPEPLASAKP